MKLLTTERNTMKRLMTEDEAQDFANELAAEGRYVIAAQRVGEQVEVQWVEQKTYTAMDGETYPDEVWITKDGDMKMIQDIEPEHARNIIRMMLRQQRNTALAVELALDSMESILAGMVPGNVERENDDDEEAFSIGGHSFLMPEPEKPTLH